MICLGIESTAHTFGVGITDEKCRVLANEKSVFCAEAGEGIKPREAAEHHVANAKRVISEAIGKAGISAKEIGLIAFSLGPGLGPCLEVGATAARALSLKYDLPIIGVNHPIGHIEIGKAKTNCSDPIVAYVSGGNSQIIGYGEGRYRVYGETLDIGVGNLLDMFGRKLGIGFPAGPVLDRMYFESSEMIELPYTVKGMDLNFSGLYTAATKKIGSTKKEALAHSLLHTAFAMVTEITERALAHTGKNEVLLTGGVAASRALREMMQKMCSARKAKMFVPEPALCTDNGAMIAWLGILMHKAGNRMAIGETIPIQRFRADQVNANWVKGKKGKFH
ncbi:MAG: bifunctional N(6)-L-threonylcarbamoyladenine synthase/serine/threonine protein kinase [archaeon]